MVPGGKGFPSTEITSKLLTWMWNGCPSSPPGGPVPTLIPPSSTSLRWVTTGNLLLVVDGVVDQIVAAGDQVDHPGCRAHELDHPDTFDLFGFDQRIEPARYGQLGRQGHVL